ARPMPHIDELPLPAQKELRARRGEAPPAEHPEKRRMGLLQRLAAVGLGRRGGPEETGPAHGRPAKAPQAGPGPTSASRPTARPTSPRPPESRQSDLVSEYAKRPPHQALDPLGRQAPVHNSPEEDHLEIPAFLRRQTN